MAMGPCPPAAIPSRRRSSCEVVLTAGFLIVILGRPTANAPPRVSRRSPSGLCLTLIHLISIPVTNTSVNPARSTGVALFAGVGPVGQLWLFWLAPLLGGAAGGAIYRLLAEEHPFALPRALPPRGHTTTFTGPHPGTP